MTLLDAVRVEHNPFVGPRAFRTGEALYGRDREISELTDLMIAERIVLLYSPSGAGKTSLLTAGIVPQLEREGFLIRPLVRVGHEPPSGTVVGPTNRYSLSALLSLEEGLSCEAQHRLEQLTEMSVGGYLELTSTGKDEVLVFDQFEEILTLDPTDQKAKAAFFAQVGAALRDLHRWAVFAVREDFVAGLDPYLNVVPTRLRTRYRLDLLGLDGAREAIQSPPAAVGVTFSDDAARRLVDDLRRIRVQRPDGVVEELGPYVEPVQLQVVCRRLWQQLPAGTTAIGERDVDRVGDLDHALADYYQETVAAVARETRTNELWIRDLFDGRLITEQGFRGQVLPSATEVGAAEHRVLELLERAHLVRSETRRGATWYELSHDRLVDPVRNSNAGWRERNLSVVQRQATLWQSEHRLAGLLLTGDALKEAEAWADEHPDDLTETDRDFLAACRQAQAEAEHRQQLARRIRKLAVAACIVSIVAVVLSVTATVFFLRAKHSAVEAQQRTQLGVFERELHSDPAASLLAALRAYRLRHNQAAQTAVRTALDADTQRRVLRANHGLVVASEYDPDGRTILTAGQDGMAKLFDARTGRLMRTFPSGESGPPSPLTGASFSPDRSMLVTAAVNGGVHIYDVATARHVARLVDYEDRAFAKWGSLRGRGVVLTSSWNGAPALWDPTTPNRLIARYGKVSIRGGVDLSRDGKYVVTIGPDAAAQVWEATSGRRVASSLPLGQLAVLPRFVTPGSGRVAALAATPNSPWRMVFWDWRGSGSVKRTQWQGRQVSELAVSTDGRLVAAGLDKRAVVFDAATGDPEGSTAEEADLLSAVDFSPDGGWLVTGRNDGPARVWAASHWNNRPTAELLGHRGAVSDVRFHPRDPRVVVTAGNDGTARSWQLPVLTVLPGAGSESRIFDADLSPDGRHVVIAEDSGWLRVRRSDTGALEAEYKQKDALRACPYADLCGSSAAFTADGTTVVATSSFRSSPILWRWRGRDSPMSLENSRMLISQMAVSPDGRTVAAGDRRNRVVLWNLATGKILQRLTGGGPEYVVSDVAYIPHSRLIAVGSSDGTVRIWDPRRPDRPQRVLGEPTEPAIRAIDVSNDGRYLVAAAEDYTVRVWRVSDGQLKQRFDGPRSRIGDVAFSPDGSLVAVGAADAKVHVWRWRDNHKLAVLRRHGDTINSVEFTADGTRILSASDDSTAALYPCTTCKSFERALRAAEQRERLHAVHQTTRTRRLEP